MGLSSASPVLVLGNSVGAHGKAISKHGTKNFRQMFVEVCNASLGQHTYQRVRNSLPKKLVRFFKDFFFFDLQEPKNFLIEVKYELM